MQTIRFSCPILMELEFSRQFFEKCSNIKFHENPSIESRVVPCVLTEGRTDMTKLIVVFRNFSNAPKNRQTGSQSVRAKSEMEEDCAGSQSPTMDGLQCVRERIIPELRYHSISTLTVNSTSKLLHRRTWEK